ncbi:helix-turn-helix domain-containing protein [Myxococcus sp. MxC21-1]|uniref:helix-turn-helix domain-containing protein n=1 Tax=Myxococcus sp. MxC21-1 TaxID=3041439 RepID=UPI00292DE7FB|nr:helix-turn-helix domain-containing protein [Myxococcus sp. MxC21-1]WNZ66088.1 helix-turn-helix domain-containing protein [Myxococcus sp. MxC21-1]
MRPLSQEARERWFPQGLRIEVPPLRERREDLVDLANALVAELAGELGRRSVALSETGVTRLLRYPFPGNVRELRNVLERALVLESGPKLDLEGLDAAPGTGPAAALPADAFVLTGPVKPLEEVERAYVRHALDQHEGRRMEAARALVISYPTFLRKLGESG